MKTYPEHEKLKNIQEQSQWLGEFMEWVQTQRMFLARYGESDESYPLMVHKSITTLLAEYFNIDLIKIENEKRDMIEDCRSLNKSK